jgi:hypothetical protein
MADIYIVVFSVIGFLISYPGLMASLNLMLPKVTDSAYQRLAGTPGKSFMLGLPVAAAFALWIAITANIGVGPVQALAFIAALIWMTLGALGGAAMCRLLGERISEWNQSGTAIGNIVRGAIIYELAFMFPILGWFVVLPISSIVVLGAAIFGLFGWVPKQKLDPARTVTPEITAFMPMEHRG